MTQVPGDVVKGPVSGPNTPTMNGSQTVGGEVNFVTDVLYHPAMILDQRSSCNRPFQPSTRTGQARCGLRMNPISAKFLPNVMQ
jgi:hypothetical protein